MHEKRGYLISITCVILFFILALYGESFLGVVLTKAMLILVAAIGFLAQLDAMQILNLDRLYEAVSKFFKPKR